jgi:uncharacterized protein (DUF1499 family)
MNLSNPLKPCPDKPNCVSTTSQDRRHSMLPLHFKGDLASSVKRVKEIVLSFPRTSLQTEDENFLHFTFKSALFGFIDDVEFYFDPQNKVIHFRSSSRTGYSDLGVNRKRMEQITAQF